MFHCHALTSYRNYGLVFQSWQVKVVDDSNIGTQKYKVTSMLRHCVVVYMSPVKLLTGVLVNSAHRRPRKLLSMRRLADHTDSDDL